MTERSTTESDEANTVAQPVPDDATALDAGIVQQFAGLAQICQARANQLRREAAALTKEYGAADPGVLAVQASLKTEQAMVTVLGVARDAVSIPAPAVPANGWVLYGRIRHADLTPAPHLTVSLADQSKTWLQHFGYAFSDAAGSFSLVYMPPADGPKKSARAAGVTAYVQVTGADCKLVFMDDSPQAFAAGAVVYRDIVLTAGGPLGKPPCQEGSAAPAPPSAAKK